MNKKINTIICCCVCIGMTVFMLWQYNIHFSKKVTKVIKSKYDDGSPREVWMCESGDIFSGQRKTKEIFYFDNGKKQTEVDYRDGKINGWARMWDEGGRLYIEASYRQSKMHGVKLTYYKDGNIFCIAKYDKGELLWKKTWDENKKEIHFDLHMERPFDMYLERIK